MTMMDERKSELHKLLPNRLSRRSAFRSEEQSDLNCSGLAPSDRRYRGSSNFRRTGRKTASPKPARDCSAACTLSCLARASRSTCSAILRRKFTVYKGRFSTEGQESITYGRLTGLTNHRPPPSSNQLKCPPRLVVHNTAYGVCCTSCNGRASIGATWKV